MDLCLVNFSMRRCFSSRRHDTIALTLDTVFKCVAMSRSFTTLAFAVLNYRNWVSLLLNSAQQNLTVLILANFGLRIIAVLRYSNKLCFLTADVSTQEQSSKLILAAFRKLSWNASEDFMSLTFWSMILLIFDQMPFSRRCCRVYLWFFMSVCFSLLKFVVSFCATLYT